jgi:GNAT superfamily N-acetyltransferase
MIIKKAIKKEQAESLELASELKEWFTAEAIKNMKLDFEMNSLIVALDKGKVVGFLCYTSYCGKMLLIWMGVKRSIQRKGTGTKLLEWLENEAKKLNLYSIEIETLPDEDSYEPYKLTRNFYYKHGFKRVLYKKARIEGWDDQIILEKKIK